MKTSTASISPQRWKAVKKVLRAIQAHPNDHPSIAQLAKATGKSTRAVQYAIRWAEEAGVLKVSFSTGRGLANCYFVALKGATKGCNVAPHRLGTTYPTSNSRLRRRSFGPSTAPPPGAAAGAEQPPWTDGWRQHVYRGLELPHWTDWRRNGKPQKCAVCCIPVEGDKGWMTPKPRGRGWLVVHEMCPKYYEGARPGQRTRTAGEFQPNNERWLRAVP
jgi:hypothetical protein